MQRKHAMGQKFALFNFLHTCYLRNIRLYQTFFFVTFMKTTMGWKITAAHNTQHIIPILRTGGGSIMLWGWFLGETGKKRVDGQIDGAKYRSCVL